VADPKITKIVIHEFEYTSNNLGKDYNGFNIVYSPGATLRRSGHILCMHTDAGITGEYFCNNRIELSTLPMFWHYLKGKNALQRERIYDDVKRALRQVARIGIGPVDIALWDIAGKHFGVPVWKLLGGYRESIPCYASTYHGDDNGGLDSPGAYAAFAVRCKELGYPAFKIHGWGNAPVSLEVANLLGVRKAVGDDMDLMIDPACELRTFADALKVGRACDEAGYFWYEDPLRDGGISQFAHRKLRQLIRTPLLLTEHVRTLEPHIDFVVAEATDFVRADVGYDGISASMKLAHACEALGLDVEFHGIGPAVRQCIAAIRNTNYYEMALVHPNADPLTPPSLYIGYADALDAIDEKGHVPIPQGTGLGVQINWDWVKKNRTSVTEYD